MRGRGGVRRWALPAAVGAAAVALATTGVVLAWTRPDAGGGRATVTEPVPGGPTSVAVPAVTPTTAAPSPTGAPDPTALADGTYPTFVRGVDVRGATLTVDVIRIFEGREAVRAAIEDGVPRKDARGYRYQPVYVRNENPLLRTLPVAPQVDIRFVGECASPGTRTAALRELRRAVAASDTTFYYSVSLERGSVTRVVQHVAVPAC
ncbi:MAG: hypothetical protein KatS3mg014_2187 [Actinomycetota bacterium]|nr:MAG: hypothetical protein KatS3mg014_2187 [Actinomycetota bacterium]